MQRTLRAILVAMTFASASAFAPYPSAPAVGSPKQRQALEELARAAVTEPNPTRRVEKMLELRALVQAIDRKLSEDDYPEPPRDVIARFLVETAYIAILNGDHRRGEGGIGWMPNYVTSMDEWIPAEMNGLRLTRPEHWVEALYSRMGHGGSLAGRMIEAAGGFERAGPGIEARFLHVGAVLNWTTIKEVRHDGKYDALIARMMALDRYNAVFQLMHAERPAREPTDQEEARERDLRRTLLMFHFELAEKAARNSATLSKRTPQADVSMAIDEFPYDADDRDAMLGLAKQPEWPLHVYVIEIIKRHPTWRDQEVIDRIVTHNNPISLRFLARYGMIDPADVPEPLAPERDSGYRIIPIDPATRPSTRPGDQDGSDKGEQRTSSVRARSP